MRALLIGCALAFGSLLGGCSLGGHDAEQVVHKDPATVYAALDSAFSDLATQGNGGLAGERGQETSIERDPGKSLALNVKIDGKQALQMRFGFEPEKDGTETRLTGDIKVDQAVLRESARKHGGDAAMPAVPGFALNFAMQKIVTEIGGMIERGESLSGSQSALAMTNRPRSYSSSDEWERKYESEMRQREATRPTADAAPMMDPNAAARDYLSKN
jgi:hypothetical protein